MREMAIQTSAARIARNTVRPCTIFVAVHREILFKYFIWSLIRGSFKWNKRVTERGGVWHNNAPVDLKRKPFFFNSIVF